MTKELSTGRAIKALYTVRAYYASLTAGYPKGKDRRGIGDVMCSEIANSCLMAIKALETQSSEGCISRAEVLKAIEEEKQDWGNTGVEAIDGCLEAVGNLPSVTPTIPDVENDFNIGYNCGYADAMFDIAEGE